MEVVWDHKGCNLQLICEVQWDTWAGASHQNHRHTFTTPKT